VAARNSGEVGSALRMRCSSLPSLDQFYQNNAILFILQLITFYINQLAEETKHNVLSPNKIYNLIFVHKYFVEIVTCVTPSVSKYLSLLTFFLQF
jgi:hypothetical protein